MTHVLIWATVQHASPNDLIGLSVIQKTPVNLTLKPMTPMLVADSNGSAQGAFRFSCPMAVVDVEVEAAVMRNGIEVGPRAKSGVFRTPACSP
jgi:hypothetical protein